MEALQQLSKSQVSKIDVLFFDCDGVTVERGTKIEESGGRLVVESARLSDAMVEKMNELTKRFLVVFTSGRSLLHLTGMYRDVIGPSVALQAENGIFTLFDRRVHQEFVYSKEQMKKVRSMEGAIRRLKRTDPHIRGFEPKQFLLTPHCTEDIPEVRFIVDEYDSPVREFDISWNGEAYDIAPKAVDKGTGLLALCDMLSLSPERALAVGNGVNDKRMLEAAGIGITTDPSVVKSDFRTTGGLHLGGEEVVDHLLGMLRLV